MHDQEGWRPRNATRFITLSMKRATFLVFGLMSDPNTMRCKQDAHLSILKWHAQDSIVQAMHARHVKGPRALKQVKDITHEACIINLKWSNQLCIDLHHAKTVEKSCWK